VVKVEGGNGDRGRFAVSVTGERVPRVCDCVCFTTGSSRVAHGWAARLGHSLVAPVPSLFTFKIKGDSRLQGLAGLAVPDASVRLVISGRDAVAAGQKSKSSKSLYRKDVADVS
jgi:hypothetical protein